MYKQKRILGVIPARGGSKGVPKKNIKGIAGKPLIAWTIEKAFKSEYLDKVVVSTEDDEIGEISKKYAAEVIKRPAELAQDYSPVMPSIQHALDKMKTKECFVPEIVMILQPTSPLRTVQTIDETIKLFIKKFEKYDSLISLFPIDGRLGTIERGFYKPEYHLGTNRQDSEALYKGSGTVFILKSDLIISGDGFGNKIYPYIIKDYKEAIDIDNMYDLEVAEYFLKKRDDKKTLRLVLN